MRMPEKSNSAQGNKKLDMLASTSAVFSLLLTVMPASKKRIVRDPKLALVAYCSESPKQRKRRLWAPRYRVVLLHKAYSRSRDIFTRFLLDGYRAYHVWMQAAIIRVLALTNFGCWYAVFYIWS